MYTYVYYIHDFQHGTTSKHGIDQVGHPRRVCNAKSPKMRETLRASTLTWNGHHLVGCFPTENVEDTLCLNGKSPCLMDP